MSQREAGQRGRGQEQSGEQQAGAKPVEEDAGVMVCTIRVKNPSIRRHSPLPASILPSWSSTNHLMTGVRACPISCSWSSLERSLRSRCWSSGGLSGCERG